MEIIPDIQAKLTASSGKVHLSNESIDSICQRVKCETEQIKLPTELLRKTIPQIVDRKNGYSMSGEPTGIDDNDSFFSDPWIDLLSNNRQDLLTTRMHESITRLMHHQEDLSRWFNTPVRNISNIQISESETHNNGRCLAIYTVDDNSKIVYKPVCLRIVKLFGDIVHDVLGDDSNIIKVPRCYPVGNDYGFMEYLVKSKAIADEETLKRFYYRAGVVLSFAYALRITDLHDGNLIASGEFPVVFDLETSFYQFPNNLDFMDVRDTGMIGNKGSSGIEGGGSSWDWQPRVESAAHGHPVLRYTKKIWFDDNRLYDGPGLADPYQYCDEVVKGFQHGYQAILERVMH